jgi:hypothetical protein
MKLYEYVLKLRDQASAGLKAIVGGAAMAGQETVRTARKMAGLDSQAQHLNNTLAGLRRTAFSLFAGISFTFLAGQIFSLGAQAEQTRISFDVLLGSAQKSLALRGELQKFADLSPFSTSETYAAGESLLAFGVKSRDLIPIMGRLGDLAKGNGVKFQSLVDNYGKAVSAQRANTVDLNQFAIAGVPIWDALSKVIGKQGVELRKYVEKNGVSLPILNRAFENLTNKGGMFFGMMEKQSQSTQGLWSTFTSQVEAKAVRLFNIFQPLINRVIRFGTALMANGPLLREIAYWIGIVGSAYLIHNGIILASALAMQVYTKGLVLARIANVFLARGITMTNLALLMSPVGWITAGIVALSAAVIYLWNNFEGFRGAVVGIWESMKQLGQNIITIFMPVITNLMLAFDALKKGDWSKAAGFGIKAVGQGMLMPAKLIGNAVTGELTKGVGDAYSRGDAAGRKMGKIGLPSFMQGGLAGGGGAEGGGGVGSDATPAGMGDITGGGSKPLNVYINFRNFIENSNISAASMEGAVSDLEAKLMDAFGRIIDGGVSSVGR